MRCREFGPAKERRIDAVMAYTPVEVMRAVIGSENDPNLQVVSDMAVAHEFEAAYRISMSPASAKLWRE